MDILFFKRMLTVQFKFLTLPGMSGSPPSFSDYQYFYSFMDRNVHAHFYRQSDHYQTDSENQEKYNTCFCIIFPKKRK